MRTVTARPLAAEAWCELPRAYMPAAYRIKEATQAWERRDAHALRRAVFCMEQGLFVGDDRDAVDERARLLVACSSVAGECDQVVGTVRVHESAPGQWWGSRLAVHPAFRHDTTDAGARGGRLGAGLIRLAVSLAHAEGARQFHAHVQAPNVALFESLHWRLEGMVMLHGRPHGLMRADLAHYPPCHAPDTGHWSLAGITRRARAAATPGASA